jgi:hypothetical protein
MADPSNFVNFSEFMGLNDEAGQEMLRRTMAQGDPLRAEAEAATTARFNAAKGGTEAYAASGERERKGLASYAEFMKGMNDPAARQALMEKVYCKGAVSALDAAFMGGASGGGMEAAQKEFRSTQHHADEAGIRNDGRAAQYEKQRTGYEAQDREYAAGVASRRAAKEDGDAKRQKEAEDKFWGDFLESDQNQMGRGGQLDQTVNDTGGIGGGRMWQPFGVNPDTQKTWRETAKGAWAAKNPEQRAAALRGMRQRGQGGQYNTNSHKSGYTGWEPK